MGTIELDTKNDAKTKRVIAYEPGTDKKSRKGGDVIEPKDGQISWQCKNNGDSYLVWFYDFESSAPIWPFTTGPDAVSSPPVENVTQYLRVDSKNARVMTLNVTGAVKYWVLDEKHDANVERLDPMIIIRPLSFVSSNVALGVTCAVLGAVVGGLVTAWLL